jgi:hypothetical protein
MAPEIALVTAGVETDVLGIGSHDLDPAEIRAVTDGLQDRPETTFGTVNADVLAHFVPGFQRIDLVEVIRNNAWPQ